MIQVTLFIYGNDSRLLQIERYLSELQGEFPHQLNVVDISQDPVLVEAFNDKAPVLDVGMFRLIRTFEKEEIKYAFLKANERLHEAQSKGNEIMVRRITQSVQMNGADRFSRWFSRHYMVLLNGFTFLYLFFALLAPSFMKIGWERPAKIIYKIYSPLCHQLAFRSFFLFGEQPYYPRELAGVEGVITYGQATGLNENDVQAARNFLGNESLGYKMALCQRDMAIYGAIFVFGVIFSITGKKIKPLPWYLWILIGLGPIGLDGVSQLLSQTGLGIFGWLLLRESTPLLRSMTGLFFGLATAWFGFPYLEESVQENRLEMALKYAIVNQISKGKL